MWVAGKAKKSRLIGIFFFVNDTLAKNCFVSNKYYYLFSGWKKLFIQAPSIVSVAPSIVSVNTVINQIILLLGDKMCKMFISYG